MKQKMIANGRMTYATRRLVAGDAFEAHRQHARVLVAIGKARHADEKPARPATVPAQDEMTMLRAEYQRLVGKKPFGGWKADTLRAKIAEATA